MSIYQELSYLANDIEDVKGIQFSIMSPDEIVRRSVAEITNTNTFKGDAPDLNGLFDPRMGVIDNNKKCKTCDQTAAFCTGHFGHIQLAKPVFYIQYFDTVKKILKCVCFKCSKLLIDDSNADFKKIVSRKLSKQKRFELIYRLCNNTKVKKCGADDNDTKVRAGGVTTVSQYARNGCGALQPIRIEKANIGMLHLKFADKDELKQTVDLPFYAEDVKRILERITDEDCESLGLINRPENMICSVFLVTPPSVRPSIKNETGQRCEDDQTHKLCDIVKRNNQLQAKLKHNSEQNYEYYIQLLQYEVSTFINNNIPGISPAKQRTGRPLRSVTERLKSKDGRIRGNLMGKRVNYSARSVITPDPYISIDELGVPVKIAMNLTFPEYVNKWNIDRMKQLVKNGANTYPGAKFIRKAVGDRTRVIRLKGADSYDVEDITHGDIIDRHLQDGDYVLFNRQPSLHRMSMMGHRVKVMMDDTFRLNAAVTPCYNAD